MNLLSKVFAIDAETTKGKLVLLVADKLIIGLIVLGAIGFYDWFQSDREAVHEARLVEAQLKVDRMHLAKELLPFILNESSDAVARGYLLSSALSAELIDPEVAIDVASKLFGQGLLDVQIRRIVEIALPAGLPSIARHGVRLRNELRNSGNPVRSAQVKGISDNFGGVKYIPSPSLSERLQESVKERLVWANALGEALPDVAAHEERQIVTRKFLTKHISGLYFLFQPIAMRSSQRLFFSSSPTLRLVGALDCVIQNWGPTQEAADYIGDELQALNLRSEGDLSYALALVRVLREYEDGRDEQADLAPEVAIHLARLAVDGSFRHRVPWISDEASHEQRKKWLSEDNAADVHSSLQFTAGEVLWLIRKQAHGAEGVLVSFIDNFVSEIEAAQTEEFVSLLSSRYGSYAPRFAVAVLLAIDTPEARKAIWKVRALDDDKLAHFEGIAMELETRESTHRE